MDVDVEVGSLRKPAIEGRLCSCKYRGASIFSRIPGSKGILNPLCVSLSQPKGNYAVSSSVDFLFAFG
ncbi:hypothetical protein L6164_023155 [Bauhinia variegata]|uniref:Uncharacterized protein n=1 Tax=Bauhinia variegata TaxID=167791 RepID=A0ACB9MJA5_BAUVA|nr:hypothetical protein L6164_023155 [Bauhinia variegata]